MSAQNLDHRSRKNRKVLIPRPAWSYRGNRRNTVLRGPVREIWGAGHRLPPDPLRRRRLTGNRP